LGPHCCGLLAIRQDEGVHPQAHRQLGSGIQLHQSLQKFPIDALRRLIGADRLRSQQFANLHDVSPNLLFAVSVCGNVGPLAYADFVHVGFVDIDAHTQQVSVADRQHWVGDAGGVGHALPDAVVGTQNNAVNGRLDKRLVILGLGFGLVRLGQAQVGFGEGNVFFTGSGI